MRLEWKCLAPQISVAESDVDDEFAEAAAIIVAGIVAKGKFGAGIWYQTNPVPDIHDTRTKNLRRKKMESITAPVSAACLMGIKTCNINILTQALRYYCP